MRMEDKRTLKRILACKIICPRIRGKTIKKWIADIEEDKNIKGIKVWRKQCEEIVEWKRITKKAKTH